MTGRRPMGSADAAWFRMDRPTNHMVITTVLTFDAPIDFARLRTLVHDRIVARFPPFRQVVVDSGPLGGLYWEDTPRFDLDLHLHRLALSPPGDRPALQQLVADLMAGVMDPDRPRWDVYLVEGYGAGCAVVARMHHCIADGIALARVMLLLTDATTGGGQDALIEPSQRGPRLPSLTPLTAPLRAAAGLAGGLAHESAASILHPHHLVELGQELRDDAAALIALLTARGDPAGVLKGDHGVAQRVAWTEPLSLPDVKAVAHATHTTVNDVLLAALSGALAQYINEHGDFVDEVHVMLPFNIRPLDQPLPAELGNRFGLILLGLPLQTGSPRERLREVHRRTAEIKASRQPAVSYAILAAVGRAPAPVEALLIDFMSTKSTSVVTNVPGPSAPVTLAGVPVRDVLVWAPCAGSVGMSVSIFSYRDTITVGFMTHASQVPDPATIVDEFTGEFTVLRDAVLGTAA